MKVGQRITAGNGDDRDSGIVDAIDGDQVTVRWDSGVVTTQRAAALERRRGDKTMTEITLTSGETVDAEWVRDDIYRLPGGRLVRTWIDDGELYQDSEVIMTEDEVAGLDD